MAARRISELGRSVRIESLHFIKATRKYKNPYSVRCAEAVDAVLRSGVELLRLRQYWTSERAF